jgi:hypothetical protein
MDTEEPSSQALNAYDDDSFIRIDDSRREQPADNTCRPIKDPVRDRGYSFKPVSLPPRPLEVTQLAQEPLSLFQQFIPISLVISGPLTDLVRSLIMYVRSSAKAKVLSRPISPPVGTKKYFPTLTSLISTESRSTMR